MIDPGTPLNTCGINGQIHARLRHAGITTIGALAAHSRDELLGLDRIGAATVTEIEAFLAGLGYRLANDET